MHVHMVRTLCCVMCLGMASLSSAAADEVAVKGRQILDAHKGAVVTILLVLKRKVSFPGRPSRDSESKVEATGTVISPDGLTVVSLALTDPASLMEMMSESTPRAGEFKMETELRDAKILLEDGTEVPAEIILRDRELDMAFVRPLEKYDTPFAYIDISDPGAPDYLDQVISINRMGKVAGRVYSVSVERIDAIVRKPRTFYIPGKDTTNTGLGSPAFTLDGDFIGVFLIRAIKRTGGGSGDNIMTVILPAIDIADAAEQAPPFKE
ncbi:MAG: hypothetical protein QGD90_07895 [Candidatus Hydrogenedentes bacterium]|nr:hypothetical protein [Candidatus Hydrogenedentota bacterium]